MQLKLKSWMHYVLKRSVESLVIREYLNDESAEKLRGTRYMLTPFGPEVYDCHADVFDFILYLVMDLCRKNAICHTGLARFVLGLTGPGRPGLDVSGML
jgi:hypothetical protein